MRTIFASLFIAAGALAGGERAIAQDCPEPEAHAFDFWIGDWDVNNRYLVEGEWRDVGTAEVEVVPVARGCGVVELWDGMLGDRRIRGFSARTWNPTDSLWTLVLNWPQPDRASFGVLRGSFRHGRGDFFSRRTSPSGPTITRYTFSDIAPDRFRWNDGTSRDSGATWHTQWIMEYSRRPAMARPLMNAALATAADDPVCTGEAFDAPEDLLGRWTDPDGATLLVVRAIGGCAVLMFLDWPGPEIPEEFFAILGFDYRAARWHAWVLSTRHRGFQELNGASAAMLAGDGGTLRWMRASDVELELTWTDPEGHEHTFDLRRPGA